MNTIGTSHKLMKIGILSFQGANKRLTAAESRLVKSGKALGYSTRVYKADKCQLVYDQSLDLDSPNKSFNVLYDGKKFPACDVLIPRVSMSKNVELQIAIIKQFQLMGMPVVNTYYAISRAKNKLRTMQILNHYNIPIPKTVVIRDLKYLNTSLLKQVNGPPVILKTPFGSWGAGVVIAESKRAIKSALDILWKQGGTNIILLQEYMKESKGKDIRIFVVGDRVVGSMIRSAKKGEFRSNIELGGTGEKVEITKEEEKIALDAVTALKLEVAGVDVIRSKKGPLIIEVNANPGFQELEAVTGLDIAKEIILYAAKKAIRKKAKMKEEI